MIIADHTQWWTSVGAKPESMTDSWDSFLSSVTEVFVFDRHRIRLVIRLEACVEMG